jgi:hypothetical protein
VEAARFAGDGHASGGIGFPADELASSVAKRRARVSARFALAIQCVAALRYDGGRALQSFHALASLRSARVSAAVSAACSRSYE